VTTSAPAPPAPAAQPPQSATAGAPPPWRSAPSAAAQRAATAAACAPAAAGPPRRARKRKPAHAEGAARKGGVPSSRRAGAPAGAAAAPPPPPSALDAEIRELEAKRKGILAAKPAEQHSNWGHLLLGLGVLFAVAGPVNTFLRTGKLFPGPHLWAGAAIVVLWAGATALVPAMQKGNETARSAHIAMNAVNVALFAWQIPTGLEIVAKVFEFTTLP
jgi:hypothetical protein